MVLNNTNKNNSILLEILASSASRMNTVLVRCGNSLCTKQYTKQTRTQNTQ